MDTLYVNIDDQEIRVLFDETDVPLGTEGHFVVQITKEMFDAIMHLAGFREVK